MARRVASIALLLAWLCASGAMLDMAQVAAWGRMFAGYVGHESISAAAKDTLDPAKPCAICMAVSKARETSRQSSAVPARGTERSLMIFQPMDALVVGHVAMNWPRTAHERGPTRRSEVQQPPPKSGAV